MESKIQKGDLLYEGKGKKVYKTLESDKVILFFKDDLTAYQGKKKSSFKGKGKICRSISSLIFRYLKKEKIPVHWIMDLRSQEILCFKSEIFPLEVVIRNKLAGSTAQRLGFQEGSLIKAPLLEFYYKKDELDDPFISEEQILKLRLIQNENFLPQIKKMALLINKKLKPFFEESGFELIDFKMEFGLSNGKLYLVDDISPDSCRIWDKKTGFRLDKDRFRRGWGGLEESYKTLQTKLYSTWNKRLK